MAQSLFDNRYRYDYIYPRGRSGETLRAVDTADNDRPVVIKRPAPNDAPPIRAGQEVSIVNERRALQRLAGHPVLTAYIDSGQFFVGGMPHEYIVMERATGVIIADEVRDRHAQQKRLPELEMLVIIDQLLDLLRAAHAKDIVYNDVDAKHLFWRRDQHALKVIDWGNAVFLEGDDITPQGISRQTDVYQVGELLYFLVTGGRRADIPRDASAQFRIDFGEDDKRVHSRLQEIISKALHPNTRLRYETIAALRADLTAYRAPIERDRNSTVNTVTDKLHPEALSMRELRTLRAMIEPALTQDPGYPPAREAHNVIIDSLRDLSVEADVDAVRIYMGNQNWTRATGLLDELRAKAGTKTGELIDLMSDICEILLATTLDPLPDAIATAIDQMYNEEFAAAARTLLDDTPDDDRRTLQWRIAERISSRIPEVMLLRPNLYRLELALNELHTKGTNVTESLAVLSEVNTTLDNLGNAMVDVATLRDTYRAVVDQISAITPLLETVSIQHEIPNQQLPLSSLQRSLNAAMALADNMHVIGRQAAASPRDALHALDISQSIDPPNPQWDELGELLQQLYDRLQSYQTYVPAADGSDLEDWLERASNKLHPFQERLFDEMLVSMVDGLNTALNAWRMYQNMVLQGNRLDVETALLQASDAVNVISPALSQWFRQLRVVVEGANYIERHALPGGLGRALADGWQAFDKGRLSDAERLGQQAHENARSESGRFAADRLQALSKLTREWVERNGVRSAERTATVLEKVEAQFTETEHEQRRQFEQQMPSIETYLKAMSRGIVATYEQTSTAALRLLFMYYVAQGTLDVHEGRMDDGEFWRDAATKTLPEQGSNHVAVRALDDYIIRRRDLAEAEALFAQINGKQALSDLTDIRRKLEENSQAQVFAPAVQSMLDVEQAVRDWSDGEFRTAGLKLDSAIQGITDAEKRANMSLGGYRTWLEHLMQASATLAVQAREMRQIIERRPDEPDGTIGRILDEATDTTTHLLGESYAATLRQWRDTYQQFVDVLASDARRSRRLERLDELFRALFIDRHPPYPLYRHWYTILEAQSEFQAPPTDDPMPRIEADVEPLADFSDSRYLDSDDAGDDADGMPRGLLIGVVTMFVAMVIGAIGLVVFVNFGRDDAGTAIAVTISATPTAEQTARSDALAGAVATTAVPASATASATTDNTEPIAPALTITNTPNERAITIAPTATNTPITPTATATLTYTPPPTATATLTYTPSITPTLAPPTRTPLPAEGLRGTADLIDIFNRSDDLLINPELFAPINADVYRLGRGTPSENDVIRLVIPAETLNEFYGNDAPTRIRSVEASLSLRTFDPALLDRDTSQVFFGLGLDSRDDGNAVALEIDRVTLNAISVYGVVNNEADFITQRATSAVIVRLRLERDNRTDTVRYYLNDELIYESAFVPADAAVLPVLYVADGSVVVGVNSWRVILR